MTEKIADHNAAASFAYISLIIIIVVVATQALLFLKSKERVRFLILFNIASAFGVMWMMSCLILPLFWVSSVGFAVKLLFGMSALILCLLNVIKGIKHFDVRWTVVGEKLLKKYYRQCNALVDWEGIVGSLELSVAFYVPGIPKKASPILSVILVISMLAGLSLRNAFPDFSIFAWGIPAVMVISVVMQMVGFGIGQFLALSAIEKRDGNIIRSL